MRKLLRTTATAATALSIAAGGIAGASSVTTEGPNSPIDAESSNHQTWRNDNHVGVSNSNSQSAYTGDAKVRHNTTGGDATSGDASNSNSASTSVDIDNSASMGAGMGALSGNDTLSTAGPDSEITVKWSNNTSVTNNNSVSVSNSSTQNASSGDARVSGNTTGGDATSGDASNTNSSSTEISVSN